jgi:MoxR-like ATPase
MEERQVTVASQSHKLPDLFMVMATQNPIEQEGTYPLPEAQMDRFLMHVYISHPDPESELEILRLVRNEGGGHNHKASAEPLPQNVVFNARAQIAQVSIAEALERYIVDIIAATRGQNVAAESVAQYIQVGVSPRGSIALDKCARAHAWLQGRDHVTVEDIRAIASDCLRHRLVLSFEANADGVTTNDVIDTLLKNVAIA